MSNDVEDPDTAEVIGGTLSVIFCVLLLEHFSVWAWYYFPWVSHKIQNYYSEEMKCKT